MLVAAQIKSWRLLLVGLTLPLAAVIVPYDIAVADLENFCDRLPRAAYGEFQKDNVSTDWFEVYEVEADIWAIYEPFQWQEVVSYLIVGTDTALLFDTGNGIDDIKAIVDQLTEKPILVLNSHSHFEHIGGLISRLPINVP